MAVVGGNQAKPTFVHELYRALSHLHDPTELRRSQLIQLLGLSRSADPISSLQRVLLQAIEALRPSVNVPPQTKAWRIYHILNQRYAGQFTSEQVATNLAISGRQLRRLQMQALQTLGDYLWNHYGLDQQLAAFDPTRDEDPKALAGWDLPGREQEIEWLRHFGPSNPSSVVEELQSALSIANPFIETSRVRVELRIPEGLPHLAVHPTATRHALLSVLTAAIHAAEGGTIEITAGADSGQVRIVVHPRGSGTPHPPGLTSNQIENLAIARDLVELSGGSLELTHDTEHAKAFIAQLTLPAAGQTVVLAIEDNADTLRLLQRYVGGTRYRLLGVSDPDQALAVATEVHPRVIVLDLMLPGTDGWELLGRLREHPLTRGIPIVVCTILPHEDLALALGAAALIRKPVTREAFLSALDRQLVPSSPASRLAARYTREPGASTIPHPE